MTDSEIITLLNNRDEAAVEALSARFGGLCRSIVSNILADRRDVEECVSNVIFKLWSNIPPAEPKDLTAYAAKTARNEALMRWRADSAKRNMAVSISLDELEPCLAGKNRTEDELHARALAWAIEDFVRRLPAEQRGMFIRRYWFFDPVKAIAERFGVTEKRVYSQLAKARKELRRYLVKEEYIYE